MVAKVFIYTLNSFFFCFAVQFLCQHIDVVKNSIDFLRLVTELLENIISLMPPVLDAVYFREQLAMLTFRRECLFKSVYCLFVEQIVQEDSYRLPLIFLKIPQVHVIRIARFRKLIYKGELFNCFLQFRHVIFDIIDFPYFRAWRWLLWLRHFSFLITENN